MLRRTFLAGAAAAVAGSYAAVPAQAAIWVQLGTRRVNGLVDFDLINVGASRGFFDKIKLGVRGNDLLIYDLDIRYGNGANDDVPVRLIIPQGGFTRNIDLVANGRFIRSVRFSYGKLPNGNGPTYVDLYGRR